MNTDYLEILARQLGNAIAYQEIKRIEKEGVKVKWVK